MALGILPTGNSYTSETSTVGSRGTPYWAVISNFPWSQKPCDCCPHCGGRGAGVIIYKTNSTEAEIFSDPPIG